MDVLIVNDYASIQGGAAQVAVASAKGLADAGYKVHFIYAVGPVADELLHPNISLVDLQQVDLLSHGNKVVGAIVGIWNQDAAGRIERYLNRFSSLDTIVHIHSWVKSLTSSAVRVVLNKKFPHVLTLHDYFTACPNGGFYNYQASQVCTLKAMSAACFSTNCDSRSYQQKLWRFTRQLITKAAGVPQGISNFIYVSDFSLGILKSYLPEGAKYWSVPNPIDIEKLEAARPSQYDVFTYVGRFSPEKGAQLFAQAVRNSGVSARFVGDGALANELRAFAPRGEFTGWVDRANISNVIRSSRAIVFPSYLYETQGMVVAEAASLGVPCIVSDACAGRDYVIDGETGLLFESGNVASLTAAISRLAESGELSDVLGGNSYNRYWNDPPTILSHVNNLINCYENIIATHKLTIAG